MEVDPGIVIGMIALFGAIMTAVINAIVNRDKVSRRDAIKIEKRMTSLEIKIEPIWNVLIRDFPKFLLKPHLKRLDSLIEKFMDDVDSLTLPEIDELIAGIKKNHMKHNEPGPKLAASFMLDVLNSKKKVMM